MTLLFKNIIWYLSLLTVICLLLFSHCTVLDSSKSHSGSPIRQHSGLIIWDSVLHFNHDLILDQEIAILPGAFIKGSKGVRIEFRKKVTIIGESHVFDPDLLLDFGPGTLNYLNPTWFGAKGYDEGDDTKSFQRVLEIAKEYYNSITIQIPIGRFYISETLLVECNPDKKKSINLQGMSMSNNNIQGSTINWRGAPGSIMLKFKDVNQFVIEKLDFTAEPFALVLYNLDFKPLIHQVFIRHCSFSGIDGLLSANINLNSENGDQVSEVHIEGCSFNGIDRGSSIGSGSAIKGGLANTKNFYITHCAFSNYHVSAIDIGVSDVLRAEGNTFAHNEADITCHLCGTFAISNYSEHSRTFFEGGASANVAFTTLINNIFVGNPKEGAVVRNGSGSLVLINNNFGGADQRTELNQIQWQENEFSPIFSIGNFYKNSTYLIPPFLNRSGQPHYGSIFSVGDIGGRNAAGRVRIVQE